MILYKNNQLINGTMADGISGVKKGNGRDWWVILPPADSSIKYTFLLVDPTGVHFHHQQEVGTATTSPRAAGTSIDLATRGDLS